MNGINPDKVNVVFTPGVTLTDPIIGRKYTISYSNITKEISIRISLKYLYEKVREDEEQILGGWGTYKGQYVFYVFLYINEGSDPSTLAKGDGAFRNILPSVFEAVKYGDRMLFYAHTELNYSPIIVYFNSSNPQFNKIENWGDFSMYGSIIGEESSE